MTIWRIYQREKSDTPTRLVFRKVITRPETTVNRASAKAALEQRLADCAEVGFKSLELEGHYVVVEVTPLSTQIAEIHEFDVTPVSPRVQFTVN